MCERCRTTHPPDPMCECICLVCEKQDVWQCPHLYIHTPRAPRRWCDKCAVQMATCTRCGQKSPTTVCECCGCTWPQKRFKDVYVKDCDCVTNPEYNTDWWRQRSPPRRWCQSCIFTVGPLLETWEGHRPHEEVHRAPCTIRGDYCMCSSCGDTVSKRKADATQWKNHVYHGRKKLECERCRSREPLQQQCFLCMNRYQIASSGMRSDLGPASELGTGRAIFRVVEEDPVYIQKGMITTEAWQRVLEIMAREPWQTLLDENACNAPADSSNIWCGKCAFCAHCRQVLSFPSAFNAEPTTTQSSLRFMTVNHPMRQNCWRLTTEAGKRKHHELVALHWRKYPFDRVCVLCQKKCEICGQQGLAAVCLSGNCCTACLQCASCQQQYLDHQSFRTGAAECLQCEIIECSVCKEEKAINEFKAGDAAKHAAGDSRNVLCTQCQDKGHTHRDDQVYFCHVCKQYFERSNFPPKSMDNYQQGRLKNLWCVSCTRTSIKCCRCEKVQSAQEYDAEEAAAHRQARSSKKKIILCRSCRMQGFTNRDFDAYQCHQCKQKMGRQRFHAPDINNHVQKVTMSNAKIVKRKGVT